MQTTGNLPAPVNRDRSAILAWLGVIPFFLYAFLFLIIPAGFLMIGSFQNAKGEFTLANFAGLMDESVRGAYSSSLQISLLTAIGGGLFGFLLAYAAIVGGLPRFMRSFLLTFSGVASNFSGVPLASAYTNTLGRQGLLTILLQVVGINIYAMGFNILGIVGLSLAYLYFQMPLMVLIIAPAIDGLKREWREASQNLGASNAQYWRYVALPILLPSLLGTMILLFGNSLGAYATAFALTGGTFPLATILIGRLIRGDVLQNPNLGYAVAVGMIIIMSISIVIYSWLQRRTEGWLR
jgi:putative spermidine/putrescine transport system permease protein